MGIGQGFTHLRYKIYSRSREARDCVILTHKMCVKIINFRTSEWGVGEVKNGNLDKAGQGGGRSRKFA